MSDESKTLSLTVRVPAEDLRQLEIRAADQKASVSELVRSAIRSYLSDVDQKHEEVVARLANLEAQNGEMSKLVAAAVVASIAYGNESQLPREQASERVLAGIRLASESAGRALFRIREALK
jgi:mevalonate pyrophosphate decarboxylase